MQAIASILELSDRYDGFILDIWGVIHDGQSLYPGVKETLKALKREGKQIVFLSNAPRRAATVVTGLTGLGVTRDLFDHVVSSGEVTHALLSEHKEPFFASLGKRYYAISPERDLHLLDGLPHRRVETLDEAEFVLAVGFDDNGERLEDLLPVLKAARAKNLPMLCANPDDWVVRLSGEKRPCAGLMAEWYEAQGGMVRAIGKPYPEVYARCRELLRSVPQERVLAVGDNLGTDIKGAKNAGLDSCLVSGGVLKTLLSQEGKDWRDTPTLLAHCTASGIAPDYLLPGFGRESAALERQQ